MRFVASLTHLILQSRYAYLLWGVFFVSFFGSLETWLPHGIHFWAQSDRLALAFGFADNGLNFFDPQTLSMDSENGSVGVEFPLIPYVAAAISSLTGRESIPFVFRLLNLLTLGSGMLLFLRSVEQKKLRVMVLWGISLSPMLLFYSSNTIPDTTSLGFSLAGIGFAVEYFKTRRKSSSAAAILLLGIAALLKATSGIYLIAFASVMFLDELRRKDIRQAITVLSLSIAMTVLVVLYDYYLVSVRNNELWSVIFMSKPNQVSSLSQFGTVLQTLKDWGPEYGNIILRLALFAGAFWWIKDALIGKTSFWQTVFIPVIITGILGILVLFGKQFVNHDYYFASAIFPAVALAIRYFFVRGSMRYQGVIAPNFIWVLILAFGADQTYSQAIKRGDSFYSAAHKDFKQDLGWMKDGAEKLDQISSRDDLIFVFYDDPPNTALVYFDRRGLTFNHEEMSRPDQPDQNIRYWNERLEPKYLICPNRWLDQLEIDQPNLHDQLETVKVYDHFTVFRLNE